MRSQARRPMIAARAAALALALLAACGGAAATPPPERPAPQPMPRESEPAMPPDRPRDPNMEEVLVVMRGMRDDLCACTDAACAEAREAEQVEWAMHNRYLLDFTRPSRAQQAEARALQDEWEACAARARGEAPHRH